MGHSLSPLQMHPAHLAPTHAQSALSSTHASPQFGRVALLHAAMRSASVRAPLWVTAVALAAALAQEPLVHAACPASIATNAVPPVAQSMVDLTPVLAKVPLPEGACSLNPARVHVHARSCSRPASTSPRTPRCAACRAACASRPTWTAAGRVHQPAGGGPVAPAPVHPCIAGEAQSTRYQPANALLYQPASRPSPGGHMNAGARAAAPVQPFPPPAPATRQAQLLGYSYSPDVNGSLDPGGRLRLYLSLHLWARRRSAPRSTPSAARFGPCRWPLALITGSWATDWRGAPAAAAAQLLHESKWCCERRGRPSGSPGLPRTAPASEQPVSASSPSPGPGARSSGGPPGEAAGARRRQLRQRGRLLLQEQQPGEARRSSGAHAAQQGRWLGSEAWSQAARAQMAQAARAQRPEGWEEAAEATMGVAAAASEQHQQGGGSAAQGCGALGIAVRIAVRALPLQRQRQAPHHAAHTAA
jgi:hypothetical protein